MMNLSRYKTKKDEKRVRVMLSRLVAEQIADAIAEVGEDDTAPSENVVVLAQFAANLRRLIREGNEGGWMANDGNLLPEGEPVAETDAGE